MGAASPHLADLRLVGVLTISHPPPSTSILSLAWLSRISCYQDRN